MRVLLTVLVVALFFYSTEALECYTGFAIIRGRSVGTKTETCSKDSDSCYKMSADVNTLIKGKLAGCSTYRCMLSRNTCTGQGTIGSRNEICCCSTDLCNGHREQTISDRIRNGLDAINAG
ncbi:hypothetical protein M3Y96_01023100 [Aphelenchoides besseyi]|nr:hypothetical protein M3Y96_01023100 [Aphelenchoides besseyi]